MGGRSTGLGQPPAPHPCTDCTGITVWLQSVLALLQLLPGTGEDGEQEGGDQDDRGHYDQDQREQENDMAHHRQAGGDHVLGENATIGLLNLIKHLSYRNIKCRVILPQDGWLSEELSKVIVPFDVVAFPWWTYNLKNRYRDLWKNVIESIAKIADIVYNNLSDIVFSNTIYIPQGAFIADLFNIPHIWHISDFEETNDNIIFLLDICDRTKFIYNYSEKILFSSEAIQSIFHKFINSNKSMICPNNIYFYNSGTECSDNIFELIVNLEQRQSLNKLSINIFKEFLICLNNIMSH